MNDQKIMFYAYLCTCFIVLIVAIVRMHSCCIFYFYFCNNVRLCDWRSMDWSPIWLPEKKIITKFRGFVEEDLKKKKKKYVGVIVYICCYMGFESSSTDHG